MGIVMVPVAEQGGDGPHGGDERASLVEELFNLILWHWLRTDHPTAKKIVDEVTQDPVENGDLLSHAVMYLRNVMTEPRDPSERRDA